MKTFFWNMEIYVSSVNTNKFILLVSLVLILMFSITARSGELVIDATKGESYLRTIIDIKRSLIPSESAKFSRACQKLIEHARKSEPAGSTREALIRKALHGKTAAQVIAEAFPE